jgi:serine/threonine protein kinase/Leucine-rich repeat (LRR) protein
MPQLACPHLDTLRQLMLGQLPLPQSENLARHLEDCLHCIAAVRTLTTEDTLLETIRAGNTKVNAPERAAVQRLIDRLLQLGSSSAIDATATSSGTSASSERYDFLAPPQGADELGRLGSYRILKVLGSGGMGIVFQAEDVSLKRRAALKVMKPDSVSDADARERFLREARAAAALEHEHIVGIYQVGVERGVPFIAMPWLKGMSLEERLQRGGTLSTAQVLRLGKQIARGLAVAHEAGLIHRDIKPANLWLEPEQGGRIKILDFGLARVAADEVHLTQSGTILGTPSYLAPEQADGCAVDPRCDLFSLGVVLYRLCTGQLPFRGDSIMAVLRAVGSHIPKPVRDLNPSLPPALGELVMQLLAKEPGERPASAREVGDRLAALEKQLASPSSAVGQTSVSVPVAATPAASGSTRRRRGPIAVAVVLALLPLVLWFGGAIFRIATNKGQIVVEVDDPKAEVIVQDNGVRIHDGVGARTITATAGDHELNVTIKGANGETRFFTRKLTLKRGGKEIVNVHLELAKATTPAPEPEKPKEPRVAQRPEETERQAIEWILKAGGKIGICPLGEFQGGLEQEVRDAKNLPATPFQVSRVTLPQVDDAGLAQLKPLKNLIFLTVDNCSQATDAGLIELRALTNLRYLALSYSGPKLTEAGLANLKLLPKLEHLGLTGCSVGDGVPEAFKDMKQLGSLSLGHTRITDAGLAHLKDLPSLGSLDLSYTRISDAGVPQLLALPALRSLVIHETRISARGAATLKVAFPNIDIAGGWWETNRVVTSQVLDLGGTVHILPKGAAKDRLVKAVGELPDPYFRVTRINLAGVTKPLSVLLGYVHMLTDPKFDDVRAIDLSGSAVADADLHCLVLPKLTDLSLARTKISENSLEIIKDIKSLRRLVLDGVAIQGRGLRHLQGMPELTELSLRCPALTDLLLSYLVEIPKLEKLSLAGSGVGDEGLTALHAMSQLRELDLSGSKATEAGVAELRKALPKCKIAFAAK